METRKQAPRVYRDSIVIDGSVSAPPSKHFVRELVDAGVTIANWTISSKFDDTVTALNQINEYYWLLEQMPEFTLLVQSSSDIERAKREGKLGIILGFQGAGPLGTNVQLIRIFHRLGVRMIALTYNERSPYASGCTEPTDAGLTSLGVQAVQEMNRLGVIVDLSHIGQRSSLEMIELSQDPVVFSHSNPAALQRNPRNITDEQMRACAAKGGVVGLSVFSAFVGETRGGRQPNLGEYLRQMDYAIDLIGVDHIAIGTDIMEDYTDGIWWHAVTGRLYPEVSQGMSFATHNIAGFEHQSDFPAVAQALLEHGYTEEMVHKIVGENWRRVYCQVWDKLAKS